MALWRNQYTLRRYGEQTNNNGYLSSQYTDSLAHFDVQPLTSSELMALPEGQRSTKRINTWSAFPVRVADIDKQVRGDMIFVGGKWYECTEAHPWQATPLNHFQAQWVEVSEAITEDAPTKEPEPETPRKRGVKSATPEVLEAVEEVLGD